MKYSFKRGIQERLEAYRNPVYLLYSILAAPIFLFAMAIAGSGTGILEQNIFRTINTLTNQLLVLFGIFSIFGTIGFALMVAILVAFRRHYATALKITLASLTSYYAAYGLKLLDIRARPYVFLQNVQVREANSIGTYGFPSGHAAVATVLAMMAYIYLPKRWHKLITFMAIMVCVSRLYLGVHLPMDLVGGFAIGMFFGGLFNFVFGSKRNVAIPVIKIKKKLRSIGIAAQTVTLAGVDARGSVPYFVTLQDGGKVFVKVVGRDNNIADWLFKSWRKVIYRRLEDETPFLTPKRQLEHEAYVSYLAYEAGIRTPKVRGIVQVGDGKWAHAQDMIPGKSLDRVDARKITDRVLEDVWRQVALLHSAHIVHRDLRCANVFLDDRGKPWLIDFGFSEAGLSEESKNRDRAELLASSATLVGCARAVKAAMKVLSRSELDMTSRYLSYAVLSSASTKAIKQQKGLLGELRETLVKSAGLKKEKPINILRVSLRSILMIAAITLGIIFVMRERNDLNSSFGAILDGKPHYIMLGALFSFMTYVMAALSYKSLALYPIAYTRMLLVELASSFASKLAPAGAGGLAVNTRFLTKNHHTLTQAGSIAGINNLMGLFGHMSILLTLLLLGSTSVRQAFNVKISLPTWFWLLVGVMLLGLIIFVFAKRMYRHKAVQIVKGIHDTLVDYRQYPFRLIGSYGASILITLSYATTLYLSALALGQGITPLQTIVVFTVGVAAASITPTPGGIGGAEAGLAAALTGAGLTPEKAISVALLYRFLTYWLPIIPGFTAFQFASRKEYI